MLCSQGPLSEELAHGKGISMQEAAELVGAIITTESTVTGQFQRDRIAVRQLLTNTTDRASSARCSHNVYQGACGREVYLWQLSTLRISDGNSKLTTVALDEHTYAISSVAIHITIRGLLMRNM